MEKINVTINVAKISKDKIVERKYTNKEGVEVVTKDYKIDIVPTREIKVVAQGDTWIMKKTHFVAESQTKEERANKVKANYIGEGFKFENKEDTSAVDPESGVDLNDMPPF